MKILFLVNRYYNGGAEIMAIRLANSLSASHKIYFCAIHKEDPNQFIFNSIKKPIKILNITPPYFIRLISYKIDKHLKTNSFLFFKRLILWLNILIRRIQVVNSHTFESDEFYSHLKKYLPAKFIITFHGHYELTKIPEYPNFNSDSAFCLANSDGVVITTSKHNSTLVFNHYQKPKTTIYYGLDFKKTNTITEFSGNGPLVICIASRAVFEKGWEPAILAVQKLNQTYKRIVVQLHLIGDGFDLDYFKIHYSHVDGIFFYGFQADVNPFLAKAHVCMLPSYFKAESMPNSVIEYLALNKPVIATDIGEIRNMISFGNELAGIVLENKGIDDLENDLYHAIESFILNPKLVEAKSRIAQRAAEKFAMNSCASDYIKFFKASPES